MQSRRSTIAKVGTATASDRDRREIRAYLLSVRHSWVEILYVQGIENQYKILGGSELPFLSKSLEMPWELQEARIKPMQEHTSLLTGLC